MLNILDVVLFIAFMVLLAIGAGHSTGYYHDEDGVEDVDERRRKVEAEYGTGHFLL